MSAQNDPAWAWEETRWRRGVEKVRAGRPLRPKRWKNGARVCVALSFDPDHETSTLRMGSVSPGQLSQGEYGSRVGVPRILELLRRHDIKASFFVPGVVALLHPDEQRRVVAEGHEVGMHGWIHEFTSELPREVERDLMRRAYETLEKITGRAPVGVRCPSWDFSPNTLGFIRELGLLYDSSLMADDEPYEILEDGAPTGVVELPVEWIKDDAPYFNMQRSSGLRPYTPPSAVLEIFKAEFDAALAEGGLFLLTMHPHITGHRSRMAILEALVQHIERTDGVWFATHEELARYCKENCQSGRAPTWPPTPPNARKRPGGAVALLGERLIGQSPRRREDERLVTGRGRFIDDIAPAGCLHVAIVRSTHARARIVAVDVSAARALPGVSVFVAGDLPELDAGLPAHIADPANPYVRLDTPRAQPPFARGEVRYVGEPVAAVVAADAYAAADAAEAVRVEYEPWPAVVDAEAAMAEGTPAVHPDLPNVVGRLSVSIGDVEGAFAEADVIVEDHPRHGRVSSMAIETRGICAQFDPATRSVTIWAAHQAPYSVRSSVAARLELPAENVRVIVPDTGGGFGPKENVYTEDVLVPVLAFRLGRPVKWVQTRTEFMLSTHHSREQAHHARLAATRDGRILGLDARIVKDVGAYHRASVNEPTNTVNHMPSVYKVPAFRAEGFAVVTNKTPSAPYRGAGRPEAILVIERLLDRLATKLGLDSAEVRRRNLIAPEEMPYRPGLVYRDGVAVRYDGGDYPLELERALTAVDWAGWRKKQSEWRAQGRRIGLGVSGSLEAGGSVRPGEWATVKVDEGGHVEVLIGVSHSGQSHETVFAQVCAEHLGARFDDVRVRGGDTALLPHGYGTGASRVAVNTGNAVMEAAVAVKARACRVAARLLECAFDDVRLEDSRAFVVGAPARAIALGDLARAALRDKALIDEGAPGLWASKFWSIPTVTWSSGAHAAVVEVDPETGRVTILNYVIVHDCGRQLHPVVVDGQIVGGFAQGLGVALGEVIVYDGDGQALTTTLMDYPIPRADDMPPLTVEHLYFPTDHNALGVRGVGEGATGPPPTVIANAISDAFDGHVDIPTPIFTPDRVWSLLRPARP